MSLLKPAKFFLGISIALMFASLILLFTPGPKLSLEFTGGTLMELQLPDSASKDDVQSAIASLTIEPSLGNVALSSTRSNSVFIRMRDISNEEHLVLLSHLAESIEGVQELQFTTIGPTVGESLKERSIWALIIASIAIVLYVAFAFRGIPRKLSPWRFGVVAVITLIHDVLITVGIFVVISQKTTFEFDTLFITALLTILGYSVNDTIVIFDRIRDNLKDKGRKEDFASIAERGLQQSITRSINITISTLIMLFSLFILGSESIQWFVLTLIVGVIIGTYSSLFLATPLLVMWNSKK